MAAHEKQRLRRTALSSLAQHLIAVRAYDYIALLGAALGLVWPCGASPCYDPPSAQAVRSEPASLISEVLTSVAKTHAFAIIGCGVGAAAALAASEKEPNLCNFIVVRPRAAPRQLRPPPAFLAPPLPLRRTHPLSPLRHPFHSQLPTLC